MIDKMADSIFESMLPFTIEQLASSPLINSSFGDEGRTTNHMLNDDHWKSFEIDFPELCDIDGVFDELHTSSFGQSWPMTLLDNPECLSLNHDCMWAGHCGSKEHAEEPRSGTCILPKPPVVKKEMCPPPIPVVAKQESILKPPVKSMIQHAPQTPPESDDEENKANTSSLLKILQDAIDGCDLDEETDLNEYIYENCDIKQEPVEIKQEEVDIKEEPEDTESEQDEESYQQYRIRTQMAAENDHSYHKDKNAAMSLNNYGLDTPSDSEEEEEIDVVSVNEKFTNASRMALSLPTNPSSHDRHQLQRRVATAMSRKRINNNSGNGIKTILPVRNGDTPSTSRRGVKRGRGSRNNNSYKRRKTNIDDKEPTDKRHLHNDMERQRRVDLRIAFENLKAVVPEVSGTKKIAKVNILLQAAQYCYYLTSTNSNHNKQLEELKRKQMFLRSRVSQLRKSLAARR